MAVDLKKTGQGLAKRLSAIKGKKVEKSETVNKKPITGFNLKSPQVILSTLAGAVVIFLLVLGIGIYKFSWDNDFVKFFSFLPYPAASVNGRFVMYQDYQKQLSVVVNYDKEFKKVDFKTAEGKKVLAAAKKDTIDRLVEDALVSSEAVRLKVTLSDKEVTDQFNQLVNSNGGLDSFTKVLDQYYKLTPGEFKTEIYKPRLLRQKLSDKYSSDESLNKDAKKKSEEILSKIKAGADFGEIAKKYSQDSSASNGGDLGYFTKGKMVPAFEEAAFSLKAGEISEPVKTVYGYHIIKVTDTRGEEIKASHILLKTKDFNTWLADAVKTAKKTVYITL